MRDKLINFLITGCGKPFEETWNNKNKKAKFYCGIGGKRLCPECKNKIKEEKE